MSRQWYRYWLGLYCVSAMAWAQGGDVQPLDTTAVEVVEAVPLDTTAVEVAADTTVVRDRYVVFFTDKKDTPYALSLPDAFLSERALARRSRHDIAVTEEDLPVTPAYVLGVVAAGAEVYYATRWLNGVVVAASAEAVGAITALPYVLEVRLCAPKISAGVQFMTPTAPTGASLAEKMNKANMVGHNALQNSMLGIDRLHAEGHAGQGVWIALMDAGFRGIQDSTFFGHLYAEDRLVDMYDFVGNRVDVTLSGGTHGAFVLSTLAAYSDMEYVGTAWRAHYALYQTEDSSSEFRVEEYNWLVAAERADSIGVDIIQSSLGYYVFNADSMNYTHPQLDGRTAVITRAAQMAYDRGIAVVVSAGNEGGNSWKKITTPADAVGVLAVGSVDKHRRAARFSSYGPTADGRVKPDVMALGVNVVGVVRGDFVTASGTSCSSPLIAGLAACLLSILPEEVRLNHVLYDEIRQLADRNEAPTNQYGYGLPTYKAYNTNKAAPSLHFSLYPMPLSRRSSGILHIQPIISRGFLHKVNMKFFSLQGDLIYEKEIVQLMASIIQVNVAHLNTGLYFLQIEASVEDDLNREIIEEIEEVYRITILP